MNSHKPLSNIAVGLVLELFLYKCQIMLTQKTVVARTSSTLNMEREIEYRRGRGGDVRVY